MISSMISDQNCTTRSSITISKLQIQPLDISFIVSADNLLILYIEVIWDISTFNYIYFEITGDPYNLIGSHQSNFITNHTTFCST